MLSFIGLSCAHQGAPSGGPVDKTPPAIVRTYPEPRTVRYHDDKFVLEFSKYVDRRTLEESIFSSPSLGAMTFDWGGTEVEIRFSDTLRQQTTYVITVGTDVVDIRNHNRMADAYALAFSTGDHIDSEAVAGRIFDSKPEGIMLFAYLLDNLNPDTLDPTHYEPDYLTQTGKDGSFLLRYLKPGRYRLIAVRDEYKNLLYDLQVDQYGVTNSDVSLNPGRPVVSGIQFRMTVEDTAPPFLAGARAIDANHVELDFSKLMDTSTHNVRDISLVDTTNGDSLKVKDFSFVPKGIPAAGQTTRRSQAQILIGRQDSTRTYRLGLKGFRDLGGNLLAGSFASVVFAGKQNPDTTKPTVTIANIQEGGRNVRREDSVMLTFSEAVEKGVFEKGFSLKDSAGTAVSGRMIWWSSLAAAFVPSSPLEFGMPYKIAIILDSLENFAGNRYKDSTKLFKFQTLDESLLGSIKGTIVDDVPASKGGFVVTATAISPNDIRPQEVRIGKPGPFAFEELQEGKYVLSAFNDADSNRVYTFGKPFPYRPAERFSYYADTLKVRARWPLEGITIHFK